ncbi:MAG: hypothetical protein HQL93_10190 [Magnetococcales bacterium]|nr:hypothetical protein [Magnetococcales bacterium]
MWNDPIVEEIREIREKHAARFNYDPVAIYQDLKRLERESGRETVTLKPRPAQKIYQNLKRLERESGRETVSGVTQGL